MDWIELSHFKPVELDEKVADFTEMARQVGVILQKPERYLSLERSIRKNETALLYTLPALEVVRFNVVACVNVIYASSRGKHYRLIEGERFTLKPGMNLQDFWNDQSQAADYSEFRANPFSITETMKLDGETPEEAAVRALQEEIFAYQNLYGEVNFEMADILSKLWSKVGTSPRKTEIIYRGPDDRNNSYQGLGSILVNHIFDLELSYQDEVPINENDEGVPNSLYEFVPHGGFITEFQWVMLSS